MVTVVPSSAEGPKRGWTVMMVTKAKKRETTAKTVAAMKVTVMAY
jgi:hypothetical protein